MILFSVRMTENVCALYFVLYHLFNLYILILKLSNVYVLANVYMLYVLNKRF